MNLVNCFPDRRQDVRPDCSGEDLGEDQTWTPGLTLDTARGASADRFDDRQTYGRSLGHHMQVAERCWRDEDLGAYRATSRA